MANGTGGVFLIGVQTVKSNKLDVADSLHPVENVEEHAQEIQSAIALYSSPQIENVEIEIIFTAKNNGYGYILIAVPLSNLRPHMATAAGENRYYRRGLDGTRMMDHQQIKDMMLSYRSATIDFSHSLEFSGSQGYNRQARIRLFLYNSGRVMAKNPFLRITYVKVPSQATPTHIRFRRSGSTVTYFLNKEPLLHAHERAEATNFNLHMTPLIDDMRAAPKARNNKPWLSDDNWVLTGRRVQNNNFSEIDIRTKKSFSFIAEYGAENCILRKEEIEITSDKILKILDSKDQLEIFPQIIF